MLTLLVKARFGRWLAGLPSAPSSCSSS